MNTLILLLATAGVYTAQLDQLYNDDLVVTNVDMASKQDKLIAGENITISSDNVISATGGGGGGSDPNAVTNVFTNGVSAVVGKVARITIPSIDGLASKQYVDTQDNKKLNNSNGSASLSWNNSYLKLSTSGRQSANDNGFKSEKITDTRNSYAFFGSTGIQVEDELYDSEGEQVGESLVFIGTGAYDENGKTYIDYQDIGDEDSTRIYFSSIIDANTATTIVASASVTNQGAVADAAAKYLPATKITSSSYTVEPIVDFKSGINIGYHPIWGENAWEMLRAVTNETPRIGQTLAEFIRDLGWLKNSTKNYNLSDYRITNAYTKTECDNAFQPKGNYKTTQTAVSGTGSTIQTLTAISQDANGVITPTFSNITFPVNAKFLIDGINSISYSGGWRMNGNVIASVGDIPTKTSELTNDSGFITNAQETDPVWNDEKANYLTTQTASTTYQPLISDLTDIRLGAGLGATAVQPAAITDMATKTWVGDSDSLWSQTNTKLTNTVTVVTTNIITQSYIREKLGVYLYVGTDGGIYVHTN